MCYLGYNIRCNISAFRYALFKDYIEKIETGDGDLKQFTMAYKDFGIHILDDNSVIAKEWAPAAQEVFLTGDFSKNYLYIVIIIFNLISCQNYF